MVKFGAVVPQGWLPDLPPSLSSVEQYALIKEVTQEIERLGFHSGWMFDHLLTYPKITTDSCFECWTTLPALAMETNSLRLGQIVTCNSYRHPSLLAKMASTLDEISKGRLEFGIGAGWYEAEYNAFGIPFPPLVKRAEMLEEAIQIIMKMWTEPKATFHGRHYSLKEAVCEPKPVQKPHPPILIGGSSEKILIPIVAKYANRSNFFGPLDNYERKRAILEQNCNAIGRNFEEVEQTCSLSVIIAETLKEAEAKANNIRREAKYYEKFLDRCIIGDPENCAQQLKVYAKAGVSFFILYFPDAVEIEPLRLFAKAVAPTVTKD
ncbi:MAG: LLM class F420-dependent oxidoreductase [Candidatus Bathyarchaeia archaeon]